MINIVQQHKVNNNNSDNKNGNNNDELKQIIFYNILHMFISNQCEKSQ